MGLQVGEAGIAGHRHVRDCAAMGAFKTVRGAVPVEPVARVQINRHNNPLKRKVNLKTFAHSDL